ncbi:hypothetical protein EE612_048169 [Oryza sativa]|nr:hypothetical protein EE612_048169 [Oryza sativa]
MDDHQTQDLVKELVHRLISAESGGGGRDAGGALRFAHRLLSSRLAPAVLPDEHALAESVKRRLAASGRPDDALAFADLHAKLSARSRPASLWPLLYLLDSLSSHRRAAAAASCLPNLPTAAPCAGRRRRRRQGGSRPRGRPGPRPAAWCWSPRIPTTSARSRCGSTPSWCSTRRRCRRRRSCATCCTRARGSTAGTCGSTRAATRTTSPTASACRAPRAPWCASYASWGGCSARCGGSSPTTSVALPPMLPPRSAPLLRPSAPLYRRSSLITISSSPFSSLTR